MVKENLYFKLKQTNMCTGGKSSNVFSWESKSLHVEKGYNIPFSSHTY